MSQQPPQEEQSLREPQDTMAQAEAQRKMGYAPWAPLITPSEDYPDAAHYPEDLDSRYPPGKQRSRDNHVDSDVNNDKNHQSWRDFVKHLFSDESSSSSSFKKPIGLTDTQAEDKGQFIQWDKMTSDYTPFIDQPFFKESSYWDAWRSSTEGIAAVSSSSTHRKDQPPHNYPPDPDNAGNFTPTKPIATLINADKQLPLTAGVKHEGAYLYGKDGKRVRLRCINWSGPQLEHGTLNGLWRRKFEDLADLIPRTGFNCVRYVYSLDLIYGKIAAVPNANFTLAANPHMFRRVKVNSTYTELVPWTPLEIFDYTVDYLTNKKKLMVILNNHIGKAQWCCGLLDGEGMWYSESYSERDWLEHFSLLTNGTVAKATKNNPYIIGYDLRNELRPDLKSFSFPRWYSDDVNSDWATAAEKGARKVKEGAPEALSFVSMVDWGYLDGVSEYPLHMKPGLEGKIVYTTHVYPWFNDSLAIRAIMEGPIWVLVSLIGFICLSLLTYFELLRRLVFLPPKDRASWCRRRRLFIGFLTFYSFVFFVCSVYYQFPVNGLTERQTMSWCFFLGRFGICVFGISLAIQVMQRSLKIKRGGVYSETSLIMYRNVRREVRSDVIQGSEKDLEDRPGVWERSRLAGGSEGFGRQHRLTFREKMWFCLGFGKDDGERACPIPMEGDEDGSSSIQLGGGSVVQSGKTSLEENDDAENNLPPYCRGIADRNSNREQQNSSSSSSCVNPSRVSVHPSPLKDMLRQEGLALGVENRIEPERYAVAKADGRSILSNFDTDDPNSLVRVVSTSSTGSGSVFNENPRNSSSSERYEGKPTENEAKIERDRCTRCRLFFLALNRKLQSTHTSLSEHALSLRLYLADPEFGFPLVHLFLTALALVFLDSLNKESYEDAAAGWDRNWGYLVKDRIWPVWIGEFGSALDSPRSPWWMYSLCNINVRMIWTSLPW